MPTLAWSLVTNLARPGGLITGVSNLSNAASLKVLELLVESQPKLRRVGFLVDASVPNRGVAITEAVHRAAAHARVAAVVAAIAKPDDIEPAMARLAKGKAEALVLMSSNWFSSQLRTIIALALAQRWASYVDRILKGARPGDLPIEQPTTFELVLNLKTAKQLGLTIPRAVVARATELIE